MRSPSLLCLAALVEAARAVSPLAAVYTFDNGAAPLTGETAIFDPETVRLILSRRLDVSRYHNIHDVDQTLLQLIDHLGGAELTLFSEGNEAEKVSKLLIMVEGVEDIQAIMPDSEARPSFFMSTPPSPSTNTKLAQAFLQQLADSSPGRVCVNETTQGTVDIGIVSSVVESQASCCLRSVKFLAATGAFGDQSANLEDANLLGHDSILSRNSWCGEATTSILRLSSLKELQNVKGASDEAYKIEVARLAASLKALPALAKQGELESILMLFPPSSESGKRSSTAIYGDLSFTRRQPLEQQLELPPIVVPSSSSSKSSTKTTSISSPSATPTHSKNASHPLPSKGPLPVCYNSLQHCNEQTNRCSGHGRCFEKFKSVPQDDDLRKSCWACQCGTTIILPNSRNENKGNKTIYWGGAACQKKDVSGPLFLLVAMTILLVGAVTWGIGLLYSIGQEELPSVIGAGVSGKAPK